MKEGLPDCVLPGIPLLTDKMQWISWRRALGTRIRQAKCPPPYLPSIAPVTLQRRQPDDVRCRTGHGGRIHVAARGTGQRLRWRRTVKSLFFRKRGEFGPVSPATSARSHHAGGDASRPCSRRFAQMKNPPCPKPGTFAIVRRRLTGTNQRALARFSPRRVEISARSPSKPRHFSTGSVDSQMPPAGQLPSIMIAAVGA